MNWINIRNEFINVNYAITITKTIEDNDVILIFKMVNGDIKKVAFNKDDSVHLHLLKQLCEHFGIDYDYFMEEE